MRHDLTANLRFLPVTVPTIRRYRVAFRKPGDNDTHYSHWTDREQAVWMFHELAASGAYSLRLQHKEETA